MGTAEVVSIVAVVVAAVSGAGSVYSVVLTRRQQRWERERSKRDVVIEIYHGATPNPDPLMQTIDSPSRDPGKYYGLEIDVVNKGETTEHLILLGVSLPGAEPERRVDLGGDKELRPHSRLPFQTHIDDVPASGRGGFVITGLLAGGGPPVESAVQYLHDDVLTEVEEYNAKVGA